MPEVTLKLNTTPQAFSRWLQDQTANLYLDFFPMSRGGCTLQPVRGPVEVAGAAMMYLDAFYWDGEIPRSGEVHPHAEAITFRLEPEADQTLTLTLKCAFSPVLACYHDLQVAILMRWPEVQSQLSQIEMGPVEDSSDLDLTAFNWRDWLSPAK